MQINPQAHRGGTRNLLLMGVQLSASSSRCFLSIASTTTTTSSDVNSELLPRQQAAVYFATIECRGPPRETLPFPLVDSRTSREHLGSCCSCRERSLATRSPPALSLFRRSPLPAAVWAWTPCTPGRVLLLTRALSSLLLHYPSPTPPKPTSSPPPADNFTPNGRIPTSTLRIPRPWLSVASLFRPSTTALLAALGLTLPCTILRITTTL
jgi:hypothetical protein